MPYNKKNRGSVTPDQIDPAVVQWLNKITGQYEKIERATGIVISEKVTPGPYKNFHLVSRRPRRRTIKSAPISVSAVKKKELIAVVKAAKTKKAKAPSKPRKVNYLNNKDLLKEVHSSKEQDQMTNKLAHMLTMLCARYGRRGNFANYTYNEDMQAYAMMMLVRTWRSFNPAKSNNPFAFFTQCVKNSFIQFLNSEKRHRTLRDELMVNEGLNPSFTYQLEHEKRNEDRRAELHEEKEDPMATTPDGPADDLVEY